MWKNGGPTPNRTGNRSLGKTRYIHFNYGTLLSFFDSKAILGVMGINNQSSEFITTILRNCLMLLLLLQLGCSTVTLRDKGSDKLETEPTWTQNVNYYWWGLSGEIRADGRQICNGLPPRQIQATHTFSDGFLFLITLGIYAPRTLKIWCD
jgi:hypothetical protein